MEIYWYKLDKALFLREVRNMEMEGFALDRQQLRLQKSISFTGTVSVDGEEHRVRIDYPEAFPYQRPKVFLPERAIDIDEKHRSLLDGSLCLMGYKPDQWEPTLSGAVLIENTRKWIHSSNTGIWENEHDAPDVMHFMPRNLNGVLVSNAFMDIKTPDRGMLRIRYSFNLGKSYLVRMHGQLNKIENKEPILLIDNNNAMDFDASFFALPRTPLNLIELFKKDVISFADFLEVLKKEMELGEDIEKIGKDIHSGYRMRTDKCVCEKGRSYPLGIVYPVAEGVRWQFFELMTGERPWKITPINVCYIGDLWNRTRGVIDISVLERSSVAVLGLGAIGSTVAAELGAAGIGKFALVDNDFFKIGNLCRHEGEIRHLGWPKYLVMNDILKRKFPFVKIRPEHMNILSEPGHLISVIKDADIIAVCIGNHNTHLYIDELCRRLGKPAVYAFVGADAVAGRVLRVVPSETGCYHCMQRYVEHNPEIYYFLPEIRDINTLPVDYGCNAPAIPGTSFDTKTIALAQARLIVQTLLRGKGSYPNDKKNFFLITNREIPEVPYSAALWSRAWDIPIDPQCPHCSPQEQKFPAEDKRKLKELLDDEVG